MRVVLALVSAAGIIAAVMLSASDAEAACTMVKADPTCWGITCRMVCAPYGQTSRADPDCGPCIRGLRVCIHHAAGRIIRTQRPCVGHA